MLCFQGGSSGAAALTLAEGKMPLPSSRFISLSPFSRSFAEAPPSGMSKNGYFFQEMGESDPRQGTRTQRTIRSPPVRKAPLHFLCPKLPIMLHCPVLWSSGAEGAAPSPHATPPLEINNQLLPACYDSAGFITAKPQRGAQLVGVQPQPAGHTRLAPALPDPPPQPIIPSCSTPTHSADVPVGGAGAVLDHL